MLQNLELEARRTGAIPCLLQPLGVVDASSQQRQMLLEAHRDIATASNILPLGDLVGDRIDTGDGALLRRIVIRWLVPASPPCRK